MSRWYDPWGIASTTYHAVTGAPTADEKRNAAKAVADQLNAYKAQTQLAEEEIAQKREQQIAEKRRLDEKQINALRHRFTQSTFLDTETGGFPDTLGA